MIAVAAVPVRISCEFPASQSTVIEVEVASVFSATRIDPPDPTESFATGVELPIPTLPDEFQIPEPGKVIFPVKVGLAVGALLLNVVQSVLDKNPVFTLEAVGQLNV